MQYTVIYPSRATQLASEACIHISTQLAKPAPLPRQATPAPRLAPVTDRSSPQGESLQLPPATEQPSGSHTPPPKRLTTSHGSTARPRRGFPMKTLHDPWSGSWELSVWHRSDADESHVISTTLSTLTLVRSLSSAHQKCSWMHWKHSAHKILKHSSHVQKKLPSQVPWQVYFHG